MSISLKDLLIELEQGYYLVPEVQRGFVWGNQQVKELLNSIYNQLPIGAIIVWEPPPAFKNNYGDLLVPLIDELHNKIENGKYLVIDGQQRLISLLLAKRGSITKMGRRRRINLYFCVDLGEKVGYFTTERENGKLCFNAADLLSDKDVDDILDEANINENLVKRELRKALNRARENINLYSVPLVKVSQEVFKKYMDEGDFVGFLEKLSDMFIKLNTQGSRVRMPDLIIALLTPVARRGDKPFRKVINEIDEEVSSKGWEISEGVYMRLLMAIATGTIKFNEAKEDLKKIEAKTLMEHLDWMKTSLLSAIECLRSLNIKNENFILSRYSLVTLSYYIYVVERDKRSLDPGGVKRWLTLCAINRRYTGRLESDLSEDVRLLREKRDINAVSNEYPVKAVDESYFNSEIRKEHEEILCMLLADAHDFPVRGVSVPPKISDLSNLSVHHIFPKKLLIDAFGRDARIETTIGGSRVDMDIDEAYNHVGNITFISAEANASIRDQNPSIYLKNIPQSIRKEHYIPPDETLYKVENYVKFLEERIKNIKREVDKLLTST